MSLQKLTAAAVGTVGRDNWRQAAGETVEGNDRQQSAACQHVSGDGASLVRFVESIKQNTETVCAAPTILLSGHVCLEKIEPKTCGTRLDEQSGSKPLHSADSYLMM
jgi:hypothetical protein